jgi:hypothetical protein
MYGITAMLVIWERSKCGYWNLPPMIGVALGMHITKSDEDDKV